MFESSIRPLMRTVCVLQVQQSLEKIARLEQEKEHWLLEAQLGKVRLEKENQRIAELEAQLAAALGGSPDSQRAAAGAPPPNHEDAETEQHAAGQQTTQSTSLVPSPFKLLFVSDRTGSLCLWRSCPD